MEEDKQFFCYVQTKIAIDISPDPGVDTILSHNSDTCIRISILIIKREGPMPHGRSVAVNVENG